MTYVASLQVAREEESEPRWLGDTGARRIGRNRSQLLTGSVRRPSVAEMSILSPIAPSPIAGGGSLRPSGDEEGAVQESRADSLDRLLERVPPRAEDLLADHRSKVVGEAELEL